MSTKSQKRLVFGLVINQIEGRYQNLILKGLSDWTGRENIGLVILSGRSFNSPYPGENRFNSIYRLAGSPCLDGLVITAGSIGAFQEKDEMSDFLKMFKGKPIISLGMILPNCHSIVSDNQLGIQEAVRHLIRDHGFRKLAIIRGPIQNQDAEVRFAAFMNAYNKEGICEIPPIIYQGDFSYRCSHGLVEQMTAGGSLPFDALISANDEMALGVISGLKHRGFSPPRDYAIIGYDNIREALFYSPPLTTVSQSLYNQATMAGENLKKIIRGEEVPLISQEKSHLVIRESCGCPGIAPIRSRPQYSSITEQHRLETILEEIDPPGYLMEEIRGLVGTLMQTLELDLRIRRDKPLFLQILNEWLEISFPWNDYTELWHGILTTLHQVALEITPEELRARAYLDDLFSEGFSTITRRTGQRESRHYNRLESLLSGFRELTGKLSSSISLQRIITVLTEELPLLGVSKALLLLHGDGARRESIFEILKPVLCLGLLLKENQKEPYPASDLFPPEFDLSAMGREIVILPLLKHDKHFGLIALGGTALEPLAYDTLSDEISQALYVTELFREREISTKTLEKTIETLKRSDAKNQMILEQLPFLIIETTPDLTIRVTNKPARDHLFEGKDPINTNLKQVLVNKEGNPWEDHLATLKKEESLNIPNLQLKSRQGQEYYPVIRISVGGRDNRGELTSLIWNALEPWPDLGNRILPGEDFFREFQLTTREKELLLTLVQGLRIKDMADRFCIAESTVKGHISQIYSKLGVDGKAEMLSLIQEYQTEKIGYDHYYLMLLNQLLLNPQHDQD